jgi:hypothetical protein
MEKLNNDYEIECNIENSDKECPICRDKNKRFWLKFYGCKTILYCQDCGYFEEI